MRVPVSALRPEDGRLPRAGDQLRHLSDDGREVPLPGGAVTGPAERRTLLQSGRRLGSHPFAAASTAAAEQTDLGHVGADGWQLDVAGRSCFCPCEGGFDELPGVFGGRVNSSSLASSAAIRASCAAI